MLVHYFIRWEQWLWCRLVATALIWPLAWEPPYASGLALKRQKKKKKKDFVCFCCWHPELSWSFKSFENKKLRLQGTLGFWLLQHQFFPLLITILLGNCSCLSACGFNGTEPTIHPLGSMDNSGLANQQASPSGHSNWFREGKWEPGLGFLQEELGKIGPLS